MACCACSALLLWQTRGEALAQQGSFSDEEILGKPSQGGLKLVRTRLTAYSQRGFGYQSQAGPLEGPGSETLHVFQTQAEFEAAQGDSVTHRVWVPVDIVTSASAGASDRYYAEPDVVSAASVQNRGAEVEYRLGVHPSPGQTWFGAVAYHNEEILHSWRLSLQYERSLAEDNAVLGVGVNQVLDWFNAFELGGRRVGRDSRSSTNANLSLSQLLSPWTVASLDVGLTLQSGKLSNTFNTVPLENSERVLEVLPQTRRRHAARLGFLQWLPWRGALKLSYRLYLDDWDVTAHTVEGQLFQRVSEWLLLGLSYRYHDQSSVAFFTTRGSETARYLTADSDLADLSAQTLGASATLELPTDVLGTLLLNLGYDHYSRSDDLRVDVATWASGLRF